MNPDILKPKDENLFSLATEMGLSVLENETATEKSSDSTDDKKSPQKPYSQLT